MSWTGGQHRVVRLRAGGVDECERIGQRSGVRRARGAARPRRTRPASDPVSGLARAPSPAVRPRSTLWCARCPRFASPASRPLTGPLSYPALLILIHHSAVVGVQEEAIVLERPTIVAAAATNDPKSKEPSARTVIDCGASGCRFGRTMLTMPRDLHQDRELAGPRRPRRSDTDWQRLDPRAAWRHRQLQPYSTSLTSTTATTGPQEAVAAAARMVTASPRSRLPEVLTGAATLLYRRSQLPSDVRGAEKDTGGRPRVP